MGGLSYAQYRASLFELFAEVDPLGLVALGAPRDEYQHQIDELVKWRTPVSPAQVKDTFLRWFGEPDGQISDDEAARLAAGIATLRAQLE